MEEEVEFVSLFKARCFGDQAVVSAVELLVESSKHSSYGQVKLMVSVEHRWIKRNCTQYYDTENVLQV